MTSKKKKISHKKKHKETTTSKKSDNNLEFLEDIFETRDITDENEEGDDKNKDNEKETDVIAKIIESERQKRRNQILWGLSIVLSFCAMAAVAGFFYFNTYNPFAEEKIELLINGPQKAIIGEEIEYQIAYANEGDIDIKNSKLIIKEPTGFYITESDPEMLGHSFDLGEIKAGDKGVVTLNGLLIDSIENTQTFTASLIFVPNNFNSEFSATREFHTALKPLDFEIKISAPQNIVPGENFTTELSYTYNGLFPIEQYKLAIVKPSGFIIDEANPSFDNNSDEWLIENIQPGDEKVLSVEGHFNSEILFENEEDRTKKIIVQSLYPNNEEQYFNQQETEHEVKVVAQAVKTNIIINGSSENQNVNLGDKLNITATYKNNGDEDYNDMTISINLKTLPIDILDWEGIDDPQFGRIEKTDYGKTITWSSDQLEDIDVLEPGEKGSINFSIPVKSLEDLQDEKVSDVSKVAIEATTTINLLNENNQILPKIKSNQIALGLNSNIDLDIQALYYYSDGTPIGTGPLPPKANETTKYVVILELNNQLHEIKDISISTKLANNVAWTDVYEQTAGNVVYNKSEKELKWNINRLPISAENPVFTFNITLTPDDNDVGKLMKLLSNITLTATDDFTDDKIALTYGIISSNLENDNYAIGKGIVQP